MQLLHEQLGPLAHTAPQNRLSLTMHLEHVHLRFFLWVAEDFLENHRDVGHQIDRVIVDYDLPGQIQILLRFSFLFNGWLTDG